MSLFGSYVPMEYFMYAGLGFLAAWLLAFACFPAVHNRAQRLLRKQYEQAPISMREMQAEKDQIRAGFAAATRSLELSIEKLKEKTVAHATDIAKKAQLIERLKQEVDTFDEALKESRLREREVRAELLEARNECDAVHSALLALTERERSLRADLRETRRELALKDGALDAAEQEVTAIRTEITRLAPLLQTPPAKHLSAQAVPLSSAAPSVAPAQANDDGIMRAWTEIDAAAKRVEQRYDGTPLKKPLSNQALRAAYAPAIKPVN